MPRPRYLKRRWAAVLTVLALAGAACSSDQDTASTTTSTSSESAPESGEASGGGILLVQNATEASFDSSGDGASLTMEGVGDRVLYFGDRPSRETGTVPVQDGLDVLFAEDAELGAPNAALSWLDDGSEQTVVVVLESASYDPDGGTTTYVVERLADSDGSFQPGTSDLPTGPLGPASLFIDSILAKETCSFTVYNVTGLDFTLTTDTLTGKKHDPTKTSSPAETLNQLKKTSGGSTAAGMWDKCAGEVTYTSTGGDGSITFKYDNPTADASSSSCSTADEDSIDPDFYCLVNNTTPPVITRNTSWDFIICANGNDEALCQAEARQIS